MITKENDLRAKCEAANKENDLRVNSAKMYKAKQTIKLDIRCNGCKLPPKEIAEYWDMGYPSATQAVKNEEGTYNAENGHFWCTHCYIVAGMPNGVAK